MAIPDVSVVTKIKHLQYGLVVEDNLTKAMEDPDFNKFVHVELNGGWGEVVYPGEKTSCDGSPLIYMEILSNYNIPSELFVCERDDLRKVVLSGNIKRKYNEKGPLLSRLHTHLYKNQLFCLSKVKEVGKGCRGMIFSDSNTKIPINEMASILNSEGFEKYDVLINLNTTALKRKKKEYGVSLEECVNKLNMKNWYIRKSIHHFNLLYGTNRDDINVSQLVDEEMYPLSSGLGQFYFYQATLTKKEFKVAQALGVI